MEKYYHGLLRHLNFKLRDRQYAADIVHDAYVRVLEISRGQTLEYPQAYLYRTAINIAIDDHRRNDVRRSESLSAADTEENSPQHTPHDALHQQQRARLVAQALSELSEPCRRAFLLRKLEELSHSEISRQMGISKDMVEKHIVNAMKHCRVRVAELERA